MTDAASEWARCREWLAPLIEASDLYDMPYVERQIELGEMHFWPGRECAAVTEFIDYPKCKAINIFALAGKRGAALAELFLEIEPGIIAWAKDRGCTKIIGSGIKENWRPVCEAHGYSHQWTVMAKDI